MTSLSVPSTQDDLVSGKLLRQGRSEGKERGGPGDNCLTYLLQIV